MVHRQGLPIRAIARQLKVSRNTVFIAFITDGPAVRNLLDHLGEPTAPPRIAPARGPPLWETPEAEHNPAADPLLQSVPAFEFDQRIAG